MVSAEDREHFRRLAEAEAMLNREAVHESAARAPGDTIALGCALSEFAVAFAADPSRPVEVSPADEWGIADSLAPYRTRYRTRARSSG
jgi:hypothetical protein